MRRLARRLFVFAACAALALACTSPTLPLPPPTAPSVTMGSAPDTFRLTSDRGAQPNALIVVVNRNEEHPRNKRVTGTIADEYGSWDVEVFARAGDYVDISQESDGAQSAPTTIQLR